MSDRWFVGDMDAGVKIIRDTRAECVQWAKDDALSETVMERVSYGGGAYDYAIGEPYDGRSYFIARLSAAKRHGFDPDQTPVYGDPTRPHEPTREDYWRP